jgi:hypothetical protein
MNGYDSKRIAEQFTQTFDLLRWIRAFRTHIEEMHLRLKSGDLRVQVSKATSRALSGDLSLTVSLFVKYQHSDRK